MPIQRLWAVFFVSQWLFAPPVYAADGRASFAAADTYKADRAFPASAQSFPSKNETDGIGWRGETGDSLLQERPGQLRGWLFPNELAEHEERILLKGLDSLCADTWCEGSFNFRFSGLKCSFKEGEICLLSYSSWDQTAEGAAQAPFALMCAIQAKSRKALFGNAADFWISDGLFSAVSECAQAGEKWIEGGRGRLR